MTSTLSNSALSRIDKLLLDAHATAPDEGRRLRLARGVHLVVGADVANSPALQLLLLTAVNLGVKSFGRTTVEAPPSVWDAPCQTRVAAAATLGGSLLALGAEATIAGEVDLDRPHLVIGGAPAAAKALRVTFDGWLVAVGPAGDLPRLPERAFFLPACTAAAALGIGELFSAFAGINLMATRQVVRLSLWDPAGDADAVGESLAELPGKLGLFGLGHLGQAYLWALASLPYGAPCDLEVWLCDDDAVELPNIETGALLKSGDIDVLKTRVANAWLERRGFKTRMIERRIDESFTVTDRDPVVALSGFDDNYPRRWLAKAGFERVFDTGLGGEASNFDTIAFRVWPNARPVEELWPLQDQEERVKQEHRKLARVKANAGYDALADDECGRLLLAGASIAVPFVGAIAAAVLIAEMIKCINGVAHQRDLKLRVCLLGGHAPVGKLATDVSPIRGLRVVPWRT